MKVKKLLRSVSLLIILILLFFIVTGCESTGSDGIKEIQKWFCMIAFTMSLICGFTSIFARNDNTKTNAGVVGIVFLIVALILLFNF